MVGMEGVLAGGVAKHIVGKLGEYAASEITLQWRYREGMLDMEDKMKDLEAVLLDADDKSRRARVHGRVYERWLTKFKRLVYDVLDELDANDLINKTQPKVSIWFSRNNQFLQRITMPHKMQSVMKKIDEIEKEGKMRLNDVPRAAIYGTREHEQ